MAIIPAERRSLLSSQARVQAPFIKVTIGTYTFGVYARTNAKAKDEAGFYTAAHIQYPNYVQRLSITKINGQINQYTLNMPNIQIRHLMTLIFLKKDFQV